MCRYVIHTTNEKENEVKLSIKKRLVKIIMRVRKWNNPGITYYLFSGCTIKSEWFWVKMTGLNLNRSMFKLTSNKMYSQVQAYVSFCFFSFTVVLPALLNFLHRYRNIKTLYQSNFRDVFYKKNPTLWSFLIECLRSNSHNEGTASA